MLRNIVIALLLLPLMGASGGCAFDREWRDLKRLGLAGGETQHDALAGRWEGTWVSKRNNHTGKLRAIVTPVNDTTYHIVYDATYLVLLRFGYGMDLSAQRQPDGTITFEGEENLGALAGGVYRYKGKANGETFEATYQASADHGVFRMKRPRK